MNPFEFFDSLLVNGGSHHRIGFFFRREEGFGGQMLLIFQFSRLPTFFCKSYDEITVPPGSAFNGSGLPVVASVTKASDAFPVTADGNSLAKAGANNGSAMAAIMVINERWNQYDFHMNSC